MDENEMSNFINDVMEMLLNEQTTGKTDRELEELRDMSKKEVKAKKGKTTGAYIEEQIDVTLKTVENMVRESQDIVNTVSNIRDYAKKLKEKERELDKRKQDIVIKEQRISQFKNNELKEMFELIFCIDLTQVRNRLQTISFPVLKALEEHWGEVRTEIERELFERN